MYIVKALLEIAPGSEWVLKNDEYDELEWYSSNIPKPTRAQVEEKIEELKEAEPMRLLRIQRDKLLEEVDWITMRSYSQGIPVPEEWSIYQQALRDLPKTAAPVLDSTNLLGISGVDWPVKP